jgi:hypothetical protein
MAYGKWRIADRVWLMAYRVWQDHMLFAICYLLFAIRYKQKSPVPRDNKRRTQGRAIARGATLVRLVFQKPGFLKAPEAERSGIEKPCFFQTENPYHMKR